MWAAVVQRYTAPDLRPVLANNLAEVGNSLVAQGAPFSSLATRWRAGPYLSSESGLPFLLADGSAVR